MKRDPARVKAVDRVGDYKTKRKTLAVKLYAEMTSSSTHFFSSPLPAQNGTPIQTSRKRVIAKR